MPEYINLKGSNVQWPIELLFRRAAWTLIRPIFRISPAKYGRILRCMLLSAFGAKLASKVWIYPSVGIVDPKNLNVAFRSVIGPHVEIYNYAPVSIGSQTVISQRCFLCTASHDYSRSDFKMYWLPITIGSEVWIAEGVMIMPGVIIGDGCVIGARSVVTKDMPAWHVCVGNPCKPIKQRRIDNYTNIAL